MPRRFPFESEYFETLDFMPLAVRRKLDLAGLKLPLKAWRALSLRDRRALRDVAVETEAEVERFCSEMREFAARQGFDVPNIEDAPPTVPWRSAVVPGVVRVQLDELRIALDDAGWRSLDDEATYVLLKLAEPGREGDRFQAACQEIGIGRKTESGRPEVAG